MPDFLSLLRQRGIDGPLPRPDRGGPAAQDVRPAGEGTGGDRTTDFTFATGIECSNPAVADPSTGGRLRRDLLAECGHYRHFREDFALVKELGTPCLRYGLPNHRVHLGPGHYDWSFADEAMAEIRRLGITPIVDLLHFGIPDWIGDFQNPEMPLHFAAYAGAVAQRYPWVRAFTPVNEIYVSARNSGWDGLWNERLRSERGFVTALKHLVAANLLAGAAIVRHRPDAIFVQSESAEYTHHVVASPSHAVKLRNKLIFLSLDLLYSKSPDADVLMFALTSLLSWVVSRRVDLNEFSLHALYRNRLVRCYLGASNEKRTAHPFTGFDPNDEDAQKALERCRGELPENGPPRARLASECGRTRSC